MLVSVAGKSDKDKTTAGYIDAIVRASARGADAQIGITMTEWRMRQSTDPRTVAAYERKVRDYREERDKALAERDKAVLGLSRTGISKKKADELLDAAAERFNIAENRLGPAKEAPRGTDKANSKVDAKAPGRKASAKPADKPKRTMQKDTKPAGKLKRTPQLLAAAIKASPAIRDKIKKIDTDLKTLRKELILAYRKRLKDKGKK